MNSKWMTVCTLGLLVGSACTDDTKALEAGSDGGGAADAAPFDSGSAADAGQRDVEIPDSGPADTGLPGFTPPPRQPGDPELPRDLFPACEDILQDERYCLTTKADESGQPVFAIIGVESEVTCEGVWPAPGLINNIAFHDGDVLVCDPSGTSVTFLPTDGSASISYPSSDPCDATVEFQSGFGVGATADFMLFDDREAFAAGNASGRARLFDGPQILAGNASYIAGMEASSDGRVFYTPGGLVNQELELRFFTPGSVRGLSFLGGQVIVVLTANQLRFYDFFSGLTLHVIGLEGRHDGLRCF